MATSSRMPVRWALLCSNANPPPPRLRSSRARQRHARLAWCVEHRARRDRPRQQISGAWIRPPAGLAIVLRADPIAHISPFSGRVKRPPVGGHAPHPFGHDPIPRNRDRHDPNATAQVRHTVQQSLARADGAVAIAGGARCDLHEAEPAPPPPTAVGRCVLSCQARVDTSPVQNAARPARSACTYPGHQWTMSRGTTSSSGAPGPRSAQGRHDSARPACALRVIVPPRRSQRPAFAAVRSCAGHRGQRAVGRTIGHRRVRDGSGVGCGGRHLQFSGRGGDQRARPRLGPKAGRQNAKPKPHCGPDRWHAQYPPRHTHPGETAERAPPRQAKPLPLGQPWQ